MVDEAPTKRAWFQLHLSTCVVLMLAAGVLVWANVRQKGTMELPGQMTVYRDYRGFPLSFYKESEIHWRNDSPGVPPLAPEKHLRIEYGALGADIAVTLAILALSAIACEYFILRRAHDRGGNR